MRQLVLEKENSEFKPVKLHLEIDFVSERWGWVNRIIAKEQQWYYLLQSWKDMGFYSKGVSLQVNIIVRLEFEQAFFETAV